MGGPGGGMPGGTAPDGAGAPDKTAVDTTDAADTTDGTKTGTKDMVVGTPVAGTSQSAGSTVDSENYSSYEEMVDSYASDIAGIEAGDTYGNNLVDLMNPLNYIGSDDVSAPTWTRIVMGAAEGDMSMFGSLNLEIAWLNAGTDCTIEWQWDGGHVPSETLGNSLSLYVDEMYGKYVDGAVEVTKPAAAK